MANFKHILVLICFAMFTTLATTASAQTSIETGISKSHKDTVGAIIEKLEVYTKNLDALNKTGAHPEDLKTLRRKIQYALSKPNPDTAKVLLLKYDDMAEASMSKRDQKIAQIFKIYLPVAENYANLDVADSMLANMNPFLEDEDWVVKNRAEYFAIMHDAFLLDYTSALGRLDLSINAIPIENNVWVNEAKALSLEHSAYLYNLTLNPEAAIDATSALIDLALSTGQKINTTSLLGNLMYSLNKWQEFETSIRVANALSNFNLNSGNSLSDDVGLIRLAGAYNNIGRYKDAKRTLENVDPNHESTVVKQLYLSFLAWTQAGLGDIDATRATQIELAKELKDQENSSPAMQRRYLKTEALIALAENRPKDALALNQKSLQMDVQTILRNLSSETQKLAAKMADSKARQAERDAANARELALTRETIKTQRSNLIWVGLAALFAGVLAFGAFLVAAWRKRTNIRLQKSADEALAGERAKSEFLAVMSHELRTPLNGIIGIADIVSQTAETVDLQRKNNLILQSGLALLEQLDGILDMSKMEAGRLEIAKAPTDIYEIVDAITAMWRTKADEKAIEFTHFIASDVPRALDLDPMRVRQCLNNLISNAIKFTRNGRVHVHITIENIESAEPVLKAIVADTGDGIRQDVQAKLFKPFTQADATISRKSGGSGLGLSITRALARLMDGDVTLMSTEGRGSEFTLTLKTRISDSPAQPLIIKTQRLPATMSSIVPKQLAPMTIERSGPDGASNTLTLLEPNPEYDDVDDALSILVPGVDKFSDTPLSKPEIIPVQKLTPIDPDNLDGLRVLVVEDIVSNQEVMKIFLEPAGCNVTCASHGIEALKIMETERFDIILMDIRMPEMDGIETTHHIRRAEGPHQHIPIIALTADASAGNNAQCMAAGADVFLTKPIVVTELFGAIRFVRRQSINRTQEPYAPAELGLPQARQQAS